MDVKSTCSGAVIVCLSIKNTSYYNKFGQESRAASPAFFPSRA